MMKGMEDKGCCEYGTVTENSNSNGHYFEFHKGSRGHKHRSVLGSLSKQAPSKWDDAEKWLVGVPNGVVVDHGNSKLVKPRNSNADQDRKNGFPKGKSSEEGASDQGHYAGPNQEEGETKKIDCSESLWRINKPTENSSIRSICVRDMGTEMTPIGSQEPSRTATPIRATTPLARSPISSRTPTPGRRNQGAQSAENHAQVGNGTVEMRREPMLIRSASVAAPTWVSKDEDDSDVLKILQKNSSERDRRLGMLETRALAWDEAERAKCMARYKREEVRIQAWENSQKRKAESEMQRIQMKADRLKSLAQERLANKLAVTHRRADEKRAGAEAKMNERAVRTSEKAEYIRRTGHLPSSFFSFKFPSFCWS